MKIPFVAALFFHSISLIAQQRITISGYVREHKSREQLPGVNVYISGSSYAAVTNNYGFYSLTVPVADSAVLSFSFVGYEGQNRRISSRKNMELDVFLTSVNQLEEVVVKANRDDEISQRAQMSQVEIPIAQIKKIPALFGEKDVLKVLQLMPGVQKGTEGQAGLYVRGGGPDQNLIILDDAVVYNANHLFGFFSVFNSDAIKTVELTKGGFPARYGGRLSSVVEMTMKEGSKDRLHGEGGIGLISSRLTLEGPVKKDKSSFLFSARRTYIDLLAAPIIARQQKGQKNQMKPGYYFYDLNAKVNFDLSSKDKLYVSGYFGRDKLYVGEKSESYKTSNGLDWGNATGTMRWNHLFSPKLFANFSLIFSHFDFGVMNDFSDLDKSGAVASENRLRYHSRIKDLNFKTDFDFYPSASHAVKFGAQGILHRFVPSALVITGSNSDNPGQHVKQSLSSFEGSAYAEDTWQPFDILKMNLGLRISIFNTLTKTYIRPEPRFSAALKLTGDLSWKMSYSRMNQYVHLLSNTGVGLPTDLWVPTTDRIAPQQSEQIAAGFAKDLTHAKLLITLEGYYKKMNHIIAYKEGASFLNISGDNSNELSWQDNVTSGRGSSYGAELLIQKKTGKLSGWVGYTLSWTRWNFPELNSGKTFFPRHDRRHDLSMVAMYDLGKHVTISANWVYGTGNALTLPVSKYTGVQEHFAGQAVGNEEHLLGTEISEYSGRGNFRAEAYQRLDAAIQFRKTRKRYERTWELGIYNVYNHKNPFFYDIGEQSNTGKLALKKFSLFPVLPSVSYNFKF
ncbi:TonB-dependent receptor [Dyadobacter sp. CY261]|uniref:TonB-dependent receptor n=1 Tax=Dyadobacter sp. CY261 TaxID=2907203 RepID=UPI001F36EC41|nr:TonB-dependent receptor [Dyadobacter sp. CY261]MCF0070971.1 TonB-dependent receptor [Dyadobacter sp. CY261]